MNLNDEQKKRIFKYCGWEWFEYDPMMSPPDNRRMEKLLNEEDHPLNGNDILEAIKVMEENGDCNRFHDYCAKYWWNCDSGKLFEIYWYQNFFTLMSDWLEAKK